MVKLAAKISNFCYSTEKRLGVYGASFLFALLLMALACLSTTSRWEVHFHGTAFSQLSLDPFDLSLENALRFRILSPLLGYILFMRGPELYLWFMHFVMTAFIAGVYIRYRKKEYSGAESLGMASLMAFSSVVYYILYYPAYSDATSYLLVFLCMAFYERANIMALLTTLLLFNHESNLFIFPWLFYLANSEDGRFKFVLKNTLAFVIATTVYAGYRIYVMEHSTALYTLSYYFNKENIAWTLNAVWKKIPVGTFMAFKLFWIFPVLALIYFRKSKMKRELIAFILLFFGVMSQMIIAYDISRLICLVFPMILIGAEAMRVQWGENLFTKRLWIVIGLNLLVPTYLIGALEPLYMKPLALQLIQNWLMK